MPEPGPTSISLHPVSDYDLDGLRDALTTLLAPWGGNGRGPAVC